MATNKTIQPTNVTVQIPAMADVPDASVFSNAIDKSIDGINSLNSQLAIKQYVIPTNVTANINSVATLNSALENSSMNTMQIEASQRPSLVSVGLIPVNSAGMWTVRKLSNNYMFMEYQTYNGRLYYASVNNGTLSEWTEVQEKVNGTMPSDANFDDYETAGSFYFESGANMTNPPKSSAGYGLLVVFGYKTSNASRIMQICITSGYHLYVRRHVGNFSDAWSNWREIPMNTIT